MDKGTCLISYLPIRREPASAAEIVSSLIFGESYTILGQQDGWVQIKTLFDNYEGWISLNALSPFIAFDTVNDALFALAKCVNEKMYIPCGANIPSSNKFEKDGKLFTIEPALKTNHHLPLGIRITKTAQMFLNTPYLWGGRSFMGIDCSGFVQIVFKANGIALHRDTSQQILQGKEITFEELKPCDLVFFSSPNSPKVSHVGIMLDKTTVIHSSGHVKLQKLQPQGMYNAQGEIEYKSIAYRSVL